VPLQLCMPHTYSGCQLSDIAKGLHYLHSCNVIDGDLKGVCGSKSNFTVVLTPFQPNILVDDIGNARIVDFGLTTVTQNPDSTRSVSHDHGHTPRWSVPEVLKGGAYNKEADIFSFAMVMIEVRHGVCTAHRTSADCCFIPIQAFIGAIPFSGSPFHAAVLAIVHGERPPRPTHPTFTEDLWTLVQRCWDQDPHSRPDASQVMQTLLTLSVSFIPVTVRVDSTGSSHAANNKPGKS